MATPSLVLTAKAFTPIPTFAVARVAAHARCHQHADAIYPTSWTAPHSYLTGGVARWELAGLAGLRGHAVRLMKRHGRHGLSGSCDGQNKSTATNLIIVTSICTLSILARRRTREQSCTDLNLPSGGRKVCHG